MHRFGEIAMYQSKTKPVKDGLEYVEHIGTNILHPVAFSFFALATLWTFLAPKRFVIWALLFLTCFISPAQRFAFLTIDFHFARAITFLILFRILLLGDLRSIQIRLIDYLVFSGAFVVVLCSGLRLGGAHFIPELGHTFDGVGIYLIGRAYVRSCNDLRSVLLGAAIAAIPVMIGFVIEKSTSRNYFSLFGGVPEITVIRDGKLRAQGAFTHPIIAGVFWAAFTPLFFALVLSRAKEIVAVFTGWFGTIATVLILFMTASSTPIAGLLIGIMGWCTYPYRAHLRSIRWTILIVAVFLHLISEGGLHSVIFTKIKLISASTGYHRYLLIDGAIQNFSDWALLGNRAARYNRSFGDVTNDYVLTALNGGVVALILKIAVIVVAFAAIGRAMRAAKNRMDLLLIYGLGVSLLTIVISMTAVSMFHQGVFSIYLTIGMAASLGDRPAASKV